jgi:hypothetical protein
MGIDTLGERHRQNIDTREFSQSEFLNDAIQ